MSLRGTYHNFQPWQSSPAHRLPRDCVDVPSSKQLLKVSMLEYPESPWCRGISLPLMVFWRSEVGLDVSISARLGKQGMAWDQGQSSSFVLGWIPSTFSPSCYWSWDRRIGFFPCVWQGKPLSCPSELPADQPNPKVWETQSDPTLLQTLVSPLASDLNGGSCLPSPLIFRRVMQSVCRGL